MSGQEREGRAFEAFFVDTLRRLDSTEVDIDSIRDPNEKEQAALRSVSDEFIDQLVQGSFSHDEEVEVPDDAGLALSAQGSELFRSDGIDDATAEELERADQEIIERKKRERDEEAS